MPDTQWRCYAGKPLHITEGAKKVEIAYGAVPAHGNSAGIVTRSVIGILPELGARIDVPYADIRAHATLATVHPVNIEPRPTGIIFVASQTPAAAYADVLNDHRRFWIARDDFDSKFTRRGSGPRPKSLFGVRHLSG